MLLLFEYMHNMVLYSWTRKLCPLESVFQRPDQRSASVRTLNDFHSCFPESFLWTQSFHLALLYGTAHFPEWGEKHRRT